MNIEDFITELEHFGFVDSGFRADLDPFIRSYDVPQNLQGTLVAVNIGICTSPKSNPKPLGYSITVQDKSHRELGEAFAMMEPNQELLDALAKGGDGFMVWWSHRIVATGTMGDRNICVTTEGKVAVETSQAN
jgi:hypothetical protein